MKIRLFVCIVALFGLIAASCGSDDPVVETATTAVADTSDTGDDAIEEEAAVDEAMEGNATEDEAAPADDTMAEDAAEDDVALADDAMADVPQRIISLNPTATEMLFAIGAGDQVVAVDEFSYFPAEAPVTDLSGYEPNIEAIAGFEPDVVITDFPLEGLDAIDIANYLVPAASNLDEIYAQIEQLGALTGHLPEAAELVLQMQTDIDAVLTSLPESDAPLTYYHELDNTLYSVTSGTFIGYVYNLFGLENIADPADADGSAYGYPQLNEEFIVTADPDIIFLGDTLCCEQNAETVAERPGWDLLSAVKNGHVVELNDDVVSRWGPRIVEFIETVGVAVNQLETVPAS